MSLCSMISSETTYLSVPGIILNEAKEQKLQMTHLRNMCTPVSSTLQIPAL